MSHLFKPGDQALTLKAGFGFAAMTEVTLDIFIGEGLKAVQPDGQVWTAPYDGWVIYREDADGCGFFRVRHLMPLRGDFTPEQQKSHEVSA